MDSIEEDLPYHVREALAITSTGIITSFFDNPYVRDMLHALNERHRPIYQKKLPRVLVCVNDVLKDEVSTSIFKFTQ
jgi:hypothetical protein